MLFLTREWLHKRSCETADPLLSFGDIYRFSAQTVPYCKVDAKRFVRIREYLHLLPKVPVPKV